jgi:hypothetical protein
MKKPIIYFLLATALFNACEEDKTNNVTCNSNPSLDVITSRNFKMGFTTWSYGPDVADIEATYQFINENADIYSEHLDEAIPWNALINHTAFPAKFNNDMAYKVSKKMANHQMLLSVSLLNIARDNLLNDYDGTLPTFAALNDKVIEDAYYDYLTYLINLFHPDYLVAAMEVNELKVKSETKWGEYKLLMANIRSRIKTAYPNLKISESITLHNWYYPNVTNPTEFIAEIDSYVNDNLDFAAISFYPFLKGMHTKTEMQKGFDFLHQHTTKPIAFVETSHIAEDLDVPSFKLFVNGDVCEQKDYLEVLLLNAHLHNYQFVIWWAHRDFDELWAIFPDETKDLGKLWRDTGLLDQDGNERPAFAVWKEIFGR